VRREVAMLKKTRKKKKPGSGVIKTTEFVPAGRHQCNLFIGDVKSRAFLTPG
jgi:hypothetical protein